MRLCGSADSFAGFSLPWCIVAETEYERHVSKCARVDNIAQTDFGLVSISARINPSDNENVLKDMKRTARGDISQMR